MVRELKKVKLKGKLYYLDARLKELKNINNPNDRIELNDFEVYFFDDIYKGEDLQEL